MPFVQGKCENCGGILTVDPDLKAANCPFCGTAYVVQDSINYYRSTINVENLHADVVNVVDENSSEARLKAADAFLELEQYDKAEQDYRKVTEIAPQNCSGWVGLIRSRTHDFKARIKSDGALNELEECGKSVTHLKSDETEDTVSDKLGPYIKSQKDKNESELKDLRAQMKGLKDEKAQLESRVRSVKDTLVVAGVSSGSTSTGGDDGSFANVLGAIGVFALLGSIFPIAFKAGGVAFIMIAAGILLLIPYIRFRINGSKADREQASLQSEMSSLKSRAKDLEGQVSDLNRKIQELQKNIDKYK